MFHYISDLHLEFRDADPPLAISAQAPYLLLAGDIGDPSRPAYAAFLHSVAQSFEQVFLIAGNHEYYGQRTLEETETLIRASCLDTNVHYLQNETYVFPCGKLAIWGGTFWTDIPPTVAKQVARSVNDFHRIPNFRPRDATALHKKAVDSLGQALETASPDTRWIVLTHHVPKTALIDERYRHKRVINTAFASDTPFTENPRILHWVYGHTHTPHNEGIFHCNPLGYPGEHPVNGEALPLALLTLG